MLRPYEWSYGDNLDAHWSNIPPIPPALEALWRDALAADTPAAPLQAAAPQNPRIAEMQRWLNTQDPDAPYDEWLKIGSRIHHETGGSEEGAKLFDQWSQRGKKYGVTKDGRAAQMPRDKWRTYDSTKPNAATFGGALREEMAAPTDFGVASTEPADTGTDTRPVSALAGLLETRLVFVRSQELYYDVGAAGHPWLTDRALRHVFCPLVPIVKTVGEDGEAKYQRPDPVKHMQFSKTKTIVDSVGMHPGKGRLYNEDGYRYVNNFVEAHPEPLAPLAHEKEVMNFLWDRIKEPTMRAWLSKFFGYMVQHPGVKIRAAPLLISAETGTGKNTIMRVIPEILFGTKYVKSMSGDVLGGQFNGGIGNTWWLYLEELRAGSNKVDRVRTTNKIKGWVTDDFIEIHAKGQEPYNIRNRFQIGGTSNFDDALQIDNNDRRWAVGELVDKALSPAEVADVYGFLLSDRAPGVLRHVFMKTDLAGFSPSARAPETIAKKDMIVAGIGTWESKIIEAMTTRTAPFDRDIFVLSDVQAFMAGSGITSHRLAKIMRQRPFSAAPLVQGVRNKRYWAWMNGAEWERATEGERTLHLTGGERPAKGHRWSDEVPPSILAMGSESDVLSDNSDLL